MLPDDIGHGKSSKPSDGLRAKFPRYGYQDMLTAEHALLTEGLGVNHLRLVMGTSMGGMHTWLWGERCPDFMDALMPLASVPSQITGRNRVWRRVVIDAIRNDPEWQGGNYTKQPQSARVAAQMLWLVSSNPILRKRRSPTLAQTDKEIDDYVANWVRTGDANDQLYALEASPDYDPGPGLEKITAPLLAVNSADDLVNPPEIGVLEREIKRVPKGRAIMIPLSDKTAGHGTHTIAAVWKQYLARFVERKRKMTPRRTVFSLAALVAASTTCSESRRHGPECRRPSPCRAWPRDQARGRRRVRSRSSYPRQQCWRASIRRSSRG